MFATLLTSARRAEAEQAAPSADHPVAPEDRAQEDGRSPPLRIGVIAGAGFPRPLAVEAAVKIRDLFVVGAEYATLPPLTIDSVRTSLWSVSADGRFFPLHGPFFVGLRAGRQHADASTTIAVAPYGAAAETVALDSWFLNPRIGFLWTDRSGFTVGFEAGVQIPISSASSSTLPLSLDPTAERTVDSLGKTALPTIDLLRIGLLR